MPLARALLFVPTVRGRASRLTDRMWSMVAIIDTDTSGYNETGHASMADREAAKRMLL